MASNKHAIIRYQALDKCFSNWYKRFDIEALVQACNDALYQFTGVDEGVKKRQVYSDIAFMMSEQGWSVPLEKFKDGRTTYYRYSEKGYSINNQPLTDAEVGQLKEAMLMLTRFKGMPSFEWIGEIISRLEDKFHLVGNTDSVIGFEQNQYLKGLEFLSEIFNSIVNHQCLRILYNNFKGEEMVWIIHPYYLKQYNTRWFLFGMNNEYRNITNVPLDRIVAIEQAPVEYVATDIDFEEYFDDIIGVTFPKDKDLVSVQLKFSESRFPYVTSKPIHWSQKVVDAENNIIEIDVIPKKELTALVLSYGSDVEVLAPECVRNDIKTIIEDSIKNYSMCADRLH